ncbi:VOC family protein [Nocardiopsis suaedae]|uniref:VOC family protein n=1 Tax=Nocardiopsis suaedae TaxID=3018444 RepID=A0ABT4TP04_9ACTN|nr:VOC family protein [Nocardiopsis suaedae]MDA2806410.1 VOC family protein [Nocardiopsis suaedae]
MSTAAFDQIVVNAAAPVELARFWGGVLGVDPVDRGDGWSYLPSAPGRPRISFQPDPEPAPGRFRFHLDVRVDDIADAARGAQDRGATVEGPVVTDEQGSFQRMLDPEGNVFCLTSG